MALSTSSAHGYLGVLMTSQPVSRRGSGLRERASRELRAFDGPVSQGAQGHCHSNLFVKNKSPGSAPIHARGNSALFLGEYQRISVLEIQHTKFYLFKNFK